MYWELDSTDLDKDFLMVTRLAKIPTDYSPYVNAGSKTAERVVRWTKTDQHLILRQQSFVNQAAENDPIRLSVEQNNFPPILAIFPILNQEEDRFN